MRAIYPDFLWRVKTDEKVIYLTFDDGPIPEITEFVLEELAKYQAKATFFCIGDNIMKHPDILQQIKNQEHTVGNHTFNHLKGWNTEDNVYFENFKKCNEAIKEYSERHSLITDNSSPTPNFRPPYGRIKKSQALEILKTHEIIMWDVLSGDFDQSMPKEIVLKKSIQYSEAGSIVLFHDSVKASKNMMYALPKYLKHFSEQGFIFKKL